MSDQSQNSSNEENGKPVENMETDQNTPQSSGPSSAGPSITASIPLPITRR